MWHWARLWEWEQYEYEEPLRDVTPAEKAQLDAVKSRIESIIAANMSSANYINGTIIPRARATFEKAAIRRTDDGGIIGAPLLSNDECNRPKGELRLDDIENMLNAFALNSHINNDPKYDDDFFLVMDHAIDQGFAFGHGNGTNHHYGYNIRKIYDAMWLMRDKIGRTRQDRRIRQGAGLLERPGGDPQTLRLRPRRAARLVAHAAHPQDRQRADAARRGRTVPRHEEPRRMALGEPRLHARAPSAASSPTARPSTTAASTPPTRPARSP